MPRVQHKQGRLALILGDQLDASYPDALGLQKSIDTILMVEVAAASEDPPSHIQRTVLFLSAMRHHARGLREAGWDVDYITLVDPSNTHTFATELARAIERHKPTSIACIEPGSFGVLEEIERACHEARVEVDVVEDPHFTCDHETFERWASGRKELVLEYFYREHPKRLGILMT
ncbi:MAG: cryptochrome/photolyase family protein, partial [Planctomycetota bacterium]